MESEITKDEPNDTKTINGKRINLRSIFFIEFSEKSRDIKIIHFADFCDDTTVNKAVIKWRTRYSARRIIEMFGDFLIQVHPRYIINKYFISARKADWKEIRLSLFVGFGNEGFMTNSINTGKSYLNRIKKYLENRYVEMKDKDGDIFFINPLNIISIEIQKESKTVYFDYNYPDIGNKLEWKTRLSASDIIANLRIDGLYKIHRRYIINCNFTFKVDPKVRYLILSTKGQRLIMNLKSQSGSSIKR